MIKYKILELILIIFIGICIGVVTRRATRPKLKPDFSKITSGYDNTQFYNSNIHLADPALEKEMERYDLPSGNYLWRKDDFGQWHMAEGPGTLKTSKKKSER